MKMYHKVFVYNIYIYYDTSFTFVRIGCPGYFDPTLYYAMSIIYENNKFNKIIFPVLYFIIRMQFGMTWLKSAIFSLVRIFFRVCTEHHTHTVFRNKSCQLVGLIRKKGLRYGILKRGIEINEALNILKRPEDKTNMAVRLIPLSFWPPFDLAVFYFVLRFPSFISSPCFCRRQFTLDEFLKSFSLLFLRSKNKVLMR